MHITYTGRHVDLAPGQVAKIEEQFAKVSKLLDGKAKNGEGEAGAHVRISHEGRLILAEVNVNFHNHPLVGHGSHEEAAVAIHDAIHKLEAQAIKVTKKWADAKHVPKPSEANAAD
jgi:ribosome-associated translation inhibitor RaiA